MKALQNKIRNGVANSYRLRDLAKDNRLKQETVNLLYDQVKENDKKIAFYKKLNNVLKELEDDTEFNRSNSR